MVIFICLLFLLTGCNSNIDVEIDSPIVEQDILGYYIGTNNTRYNYANDVLTIINLDNNIAVDYYVKNLQLFSSNEMPETDKTVLGNLIINDTYIDAYIEGKLYKTYNLNKIDEYVIGDYNEFIDKVNDLFEAVSDKTNYSIGIDMSGNPFITSDVRTIYYDIDGNIQLKDSSEDCISYIQFYRNIIDYNTYSQLLKVDYTKVLIPLDNGTVKVLGD